MDNSEKRLASVRKNIAKAEMKIAKIKEALSSGKVPCHYDSADLSRAENDLAYYKKQLKSYFDKIKEAESLEKIEVLELFFNQWKIRTANWIRVDYSNLLIYLAQQKWDARYVKKIEFAKNSDTKKFHPITLSLYNKRGSFEESLNELLEREVMLKRGLLIKRIKRITGPIIDVSHLRISETGDLDGYVVGEQGTASINTISAGGYNVQCYHFRILVSRIK